MALDSLLFLKRYGQLDDALDDYVGQHKLEDNETHGKTPKTTCVSTTLIPIKNIETDSGVSMASNRSGKASPLSQKKCLSIADIHIGIEGLLEDIEFQYELETCLQRSATTRLLARYWEVHSSLKAINCYKAIANIWLYYANKIEFTEAGLLSGIASFSFVFEKLKANAYVNEEALAHFVFYKVLTFTDAFIDTLKKDSRLYKAMAALIGEVLSTIKQQGGFEGASFEGLGSITDRDRKIQYYREMHGHSAACPCHCNENSSAKINPMGVFGRKALLEERPKKSSTISKIR